MGNLHRGPIGPHPRLPPFARLPPTDSGAHPLPMHRRWRHWTGRLAMGHRGPRSPARCPGADGKCCFPFRLPRLRGAPPLWECTSSRFAARIWNLGQRGIARKGRKVRHIWDLRWHGESKAIADPANGTALSCCELCGHSVCGLAHIVCECPSLSHMRANFHHDLVHFTSRQPSALVTRLMQRYVQLLFSHLELDQRGHLWLGHLPPSLRQQLEPLLQGLTLRDGQAALLRLGSRVAQGYCALWDSYEEALSTATPTTPEVDFSMAAPLSSQPDATPPPTPESPPPYWQPPPWTARLDADHG